MEIRTLNCICCGAPLETLDAEGLYTCSHCNALHAASESHSARFGQTIDEIHQTAQQIAERLEDIDLGRRKDAPPVVRRPDLNAAVVFAVTFCSLGLLLCMIGFGASASAFLTGLGCILAGIVGAIVIDNKAADDERRRRMFARYHSRPESIGVMRGVRPD